MSTVDLLKQEVARLKVDVCDLILRNAQLETEPETTTSEA